MYMKKKPILDFFQNAILKIFEFSPFNSVYLGRNHLETKTVETEEKLKVTAFKLNQNCWLVFTTKGENRILEFMI